MTSFTKDSFTDNYLGKKQPALAANFKMNFKDARLVGFLPEGNDLGDISVLGFTASIPPSVLTVLEVGYVGGFVTPVPGKIQPQNITLAFYENNAFLAETFFGNWKSKYVETYPEEPDSQVSTDSNDYKIDLEIELLNNQRMTTTILRLKQAFPFTIINPEYAWSQATEVPVIQVGLTFDYAEFENFSTD